MRIIEGMVNKIKVQQPIELISYTQEELDNACYAIRDVYVARLVKWETNSKGTRTCRLVGQDVPIAHIHGNWYMNILTGDYYERGVDYKFEVDNVEYIYDANPFEYRYYNTMKNMRISTWATIMGKHFKEIIEEDKKILIK